jgi:hypothetical protein
VGWNSVADKHQVAIADVATKWVLDKDTVPAVIIGARNANHVDEHRRLATFQLDAADNAVRRTTSHGGDAKALGFDLVVELGLRVGTHSDPNPWLAGDRRGSGAGQATPWRLLQLGARPWRVLAVVDRECAGSSTFYIVENRCHSPPAARY